MDHLDDLIKYGLMLFSAGSLYGLIRADLKSLHEKMRDSAEDLHRVENTAQKAHERLDAHVTAYHRGN